MALLRTHNTYNKNKVRNDTENKAYHCNSKMSKKGHATVHPLFVKQSLK